MARFLAIDWNDHECRYLLATVQKSGVSIHKAGTLAFETDAEDSSDRDPQRVAALLRQLVRAERIGSCPLLMTLDRNRVEMQYVQLPPSRDSEIPAMLKNQVLRELPGVSDYDPLDYLALAHHADEGCRLLALTIPMSYRQSLNKAFKAAGRPPRQIGFRAVAAAELVIHSGQAPAALEPGLVVNAVGNDVDLVILEGTDFVSIRTFRLPEPLTPQETAARIADEIRRTLTVSSDGAAGGTKTKIFLFGNADDGSLLQAELETAGLAEELDICVLHPFELPGVAAVSIPKPLKKPSFVEPPSPESRSVEGRNTGSVKCIQYNAVLPAQPGQFAPLVGLLLSRQPGRASRIDFLHPKEAPKPTNYTLPSLLFLVFLGICVYGLFDWNQRVIRSLEAELERTQKEHALVAEQVREIFPRWNVLSQTQQWESQNIPWLDDLRLFSLLMPSEQDIVVTQMSFVTGPINNNPRMRGMIQLSGLARDPAVLRKLQTDLQAQGYLMQNPNPRSNPAGGGYPWLFQTTIYRTR